MFTNLEISLINDKAQYKRQLALQVEANKFLIKYVEDTLEVLSQKSKKIQSLTSQLNEKSKKILELENQVSWLKAKLHEATEEEITAEDAEKLIVKSILELLELF